MIYPKSSKGSCHNNTIKKRRLIIYTHKQTKQQKQTKKNIECTQWKKKKKGERKQKTTKQKTTQIKIKVP